MSVIDVAALIAPLSADAPGGPNLEYDQALRDLEELAQGKEERAIGDSVIPAQDPDWKQVKQRAIDLFSRTRDLRVSMLLSTALLKEDGLAGFRAGVDVVKGFVETPLWDHFHPQLDPSDNNDPMFRVNILKAFSGDGSDLYKFRQRLREAPLTNSKRLGRFSFRDIQIAKGEVPPPPAGKDGAAPKIPTTAEIEGAFAETPTGELETTLATLKETHAALVALDKALGDRIGAGTGPDFTALKGVLTQIQAVVNEQLAKRGKGDAAAGAVDDASASADAPRSGSSLTGDINSRADVLRAIDKICAYYDRVEPASPVPVFLQRAKRLVPLSFVDVIKDLAPEAIAKIEVYTGTPPTPAE